MAATISAALVVPTVGQRQVIKPAAKTFKAATVSNGNVQKCSAMQVWTPVNNKFFETFSYLPALTNDQIARQVDFIVNNGWTPCLEFADPETSYVNSNSAIRFSNGVAVNYFDNRYWTMWKLPMFGCTDPSQVLREVSNCTRAFPDAYIRLVAFDSIRQVQVAGFLVHRPRSCNEYRQPGERSV